MFLGSQTVPQDLLLIQEIVCHSTAPTPPRLDVDLSPSRPDVNLSHDDSDSDTDVASSEASLSHGSEGEIREIETNLLVKTETVESELCVLSSESESTSDSGSEEGQPLESIHKRLDEEEEEEEEGIAPTFIARTLPKTKNEITDVDLPTPDFTSVDTDEIIEEAGEVMSVLDQIVIVRGVPSANPATGSGRALDSETLLVFEDKTVLGYIYETFGPTSQPLYQVKFNDKFRLDTDRVKLSRKVYHIPKRSNFVFLDKIKHFKGCDASNINDEEPAEDEMEFSDDEQESAFRGRRKRKRADSRTASTFSSRHATPTPSQKRDQDLVETYIIDTNPFAEHGAYDYGSGSSRPLPIPYDDPYADAYNVNAGTAPLLDTTSPPPTRSDHHQERGASLGRQPHFQRPRYESPGRGGHGLGVRRRGRSRGRGNSGRERLEYRTDQVQRPFDSNRSPHPLPYDPRMPPPPDVAQASESVPTTFAARSPTAFTSPMSPTTWSPFPHQQQYQHGFPHYPLSHEQQYVQPHINPRFASAFGFHLNLLQQQPHVSPYDRYAQQTDPRSAPGGPWPNDWQIPPGH